MKLLMYKKIIDINSLKSIVFSAIISLIIMQSITFNCNKNNWLFHNNILSFLTLFLIIFFVVLFAIILMTRINIQYKNTDVRKLFIIIYALPCIIIWTLYLLAFYPGIMTNDSFNQWYQAHSHVFSDWHPVVHTLFIWAVTRVWDAPQAIALTQMLIFSFTVGYVLYTLAKMGISKKLLLIVSVIFALFPSNGAMSIGIWKDLIYNCCLVILTVFIMKILFTDGKWIDSTINMIYFIFISLSIILFRHNGIVPLVGSIILLMLIYRTRLKRYILVSSIIAFLFFLVEVPFYHFLRVAPGSSNEAFAIPTQQIAAVVKYNGYLTTEQKKAISRIMPLKSIQNDYHPYSVDLIKFQDDFHKNVIEQDKKGFIKLWIGVCIQNPKIVTEAFLNQTSIVWQIAEPSGRGYTYTINREVVKNYYNVKNIIINQNITYWGNKVIDYTEIKSIKWAFWRPALPLFIIILSGFILAIKNDKKYLVLLGPVIFNNLSILIAIPAQDFRYLHANYLASVVIFFAALIKISYDNKIKTTD